MRLVVALLALGMAAFNCCLARVEAGGCYRPFATAGYAAPAVVNTYQVPYATAPVYHAPTYAATPTYQTYTYKELVPYVLEVQVNQDRYYSLSDLYRDRLYLESFDMMREMRQTIRQLKEEKDQTPPTFNSTGPTASAVPRANIPEPPQPPLPPEKAGGKTGPNALKVLKESCLNCHGAGHPKLDLTDPDKVPMTKRWASFGMAAAGDMPQPPATLRARGKEAELVAWKKENALKEEAMKAVYEEWVLSRK